MKRITMSVTVVMVMAAMLVASAMPAFADKGGGGHSTNEGDCVAEACQFVTTEAGNQKAEEGYAGRYSSTETSDFSSDPPVYKEEVSTRGGGKGIGGGNCTDTYDYVSGEVTSDHHGKRCG